MYNNIIYCLAHDARDVALVSAEDEVGVLAAGLTKTPKHSSTYFNIVQQQIQNTSVYIYIYIYVYVLCAYIYIYIYMYSHTHIDVQLYG